MRRFAWPLPRHLHHTQTHLRNRNGAPPPLNGGSVHPRSGTEGLPLLWPQHLWPHHLWPHHLWSSLLLSHCQLGPKMALSFVHSRRSRKSGVQNRQFPRLPVLTLPEESAGLRRLLLCPRRQRLIILWCAHRLQASKCLRHQCVSPFMVWTMTMMSPSEPFGLLASHMCCFSWLSIALLLT